MEMFLHCDLLCHGEFFVFHFSYSAAIRNIFIWYNYVPSLTSTRELAELLKYIFQNYWLQLFYQPITISDVKIPKSFFLVLFPCRSLGGSWNLSKATYGWKQGIHNRTLWALGVFCTLLKGTLTVGIWSCNGTPSTPSTPSVFCST